MLCREWEPVRRRLECLLEVKHGRGKVAKIKLPRTSEETARSWLMKTMWKSPLEAGSRSLHVELVASSSNEMKQHEASWH